MASSVKAEKTAIGGAEGLDLCFAGTVATLRLDRPHVHNALDDALLARIESTLVEVDRNADVRAVVMTGTGRSFSAGDDLKNLRASSVSAFGDTICALQRITAAIVALSKPIVAALNGPAYGAGLELVLACDMRVATPDFVCATPEVRLGLVATNGTSLLLPLMIGPSRARQMLLSGSSRDAAWCEKVGLIDEVVPDDRLLGRATEVALELASGAPQATAATRALLNGPLAAMMKGALDAEAAACIAARASGEAGEGVDAFFARRTPDWTVA